MSRIMDTSALRQKIGNIKRSEASRNQNVQDTCIGIVGHALKYGSSPLGTLLLAQLHDVDKKAVGVWLNQHGPFVIEGGVDVVFSKKIRKERFANVNTDDEIESYLDELAGDDTPYWYEAKATRKSRAAATKDAVELIGKLVKSLKKANQDEPVENVGLLSYVEGAIARYTSDMALAAAQASAAEAARVEAERLAAELREEARKLEEQRLAALADQPTVPEADEVTA